MDKNISGGKITDKIKAVRIALNLTQAELAERFGVSSTTIARWERGEVKPDAPGMLALALAALQMERLPETDEFVSRKEKIKASVRQTLADSRQRVRHSRQSDYTDGHPIQQSETDIS